MTRRGFLQSLGVRGRVLILAMLPVAVAVVLLGYNLASSRLEDAERNLAERGALIARNLALASEFSLFSQNVPLLNDTLVRVANEPEVRWTAIWDPRRGALITQGKGPDDSKKRAIVVALERSHALPPSVYHAPIRVEQVNMTDFHDEFDPPGTTRDQLLGFAIIEIERTQLDTHRARIMRDTTLITMAGLAGSILLALLIGNSITTPIMRLLGAVRQLQSGNLAARVKVRAGGEIGDLEQGVNQMAEALEKSQQVLRLRVEQATEALRQTVKELETRNRELEGARQLAISAGQERTEFLARMSHEIRTPLNAVVGFTRLLQTDSSERSNEEHIRVIQHAAEQLLYVINDILQFIRLDAGAEQLESLQFDLADVLEDAVAMLGPTAGEKDLELILLLHSDLPEHVYGDPSRLSQVIVNLVNNAIKFTPEGQVVVEASRVANEYGDDDIEISVTDTGIGLDPEEQNRVFAAFAQGDSSVTRRFGGTGLGLSIARRLVELMGGSIGIHSSKGQGSRFWFRLPCPEQGASAPIELAGPLAGRRILVYDSNPFVRRSLRSILAAWGIQVFNTGSWKRVSEMVQDAATNGTFCALIVGLSGPERRADLVERYVADIRRHYRGYVLLLTGSETWTPPDQVRDATPLDWATKPIRRATLRRLLEEHLAASGSQQQQPTPSSGPRALLGMQVLVAEDNEFNRLLLRHLLEDQGATVDEAVTGLAAVSAAESAAYDVILMDLHMPELDGAAAATRIRAALGAESPPIFALTADVFRRGENDAAAFDDWLLKPIDADQLLRRLAALREPQGPAHVALSLPQAGPSTLPLELQQQYAVELGRLVDRVRETSAAHDEAGLLKAMHDLKGTLGLFGDARLRQLLDNLDRDLFSGSPARTAQWLDELSAHSRALIAQNADAAD